MATPIQTPLTFSAGERHFLYCLAAKGLSVRCCALDGDEWAALLPAHAGDDAEPVLSVQLSGEFGGRYVALDPGARVVARGDDLSCLLSDALQSLAEREATAWAATAIALARGAR